jgi:SAM-dependent methyltransferase
MKEINPFENELVAQEWITSVEWEKWLIRDKDIYPMLSQRTENLQGNLLEIWSWQWICSEKIPLFKWKYIWLEPSIPLTQRANSLYQNINRSFIVWNVYKIPLENEYINNAFSVNVWFHLKDLITASGEIHRVLKYWGQFLIITANPNSHHIWETFYENVEKIWNAIIWKVNIPVNPLSQNIFFQHTIEEIITSLKKAKLNIDLIEEFWDANWNKLFIKILCKK